MRLRASRLPVLVAVKDEITYPELLQEPGSVGIEVTEPRRGRAVRALDLADKALDEIAVGAGNEPGVAVDQWLPVQRRPEHRLPIVPAYAGRRRVGEDALGRELHHGARWLGCQPPCCRARAGSMIDGLDGNGARPEISKNCCREHGCQRWTGPRAVQKLLESRIGAHAVPS